MRFDQIRPRLSGNRRKAFENLNKKERRILIIGDIHAPFELEGYHQFCLDIYAKYNCNQVIFIGDIIDNHYASYHETDPDGFSGGEELAYAIRDVDKWKNSFPKADVIIGNHDRMIMRKAQTSLIPSKWIKSYKEVLEVPNWNFVDRLEIDGVQYIHGEAGTARTKCRADMMNTVQGHLHTQCYIEHYVGQNFRVFGMQVGCGINHDSYAMAYAKRGKKPSIACGVILSGTTPINLLMPL